MGTQLTQTKISKKIIWPYNLDPGKREQLLVPMFLRIGWTLKIMIRELHNFRVTNRVNQITAHISPLIVKFNIINLNFQ